MTNPLGITGGVAVSFVCDDVRVGLWAGDGRESLMREHPMRTGETPWQPEKGSALNGAPHSSPTKQ